MATLASPSKKQSYEQVEYEQGLLLENCHPTGPQSIRLKQPVSPTGTERVHRELAGAGKAIGFSR